MFWEQCKKQERLHIRDKKIFWFPVRFSRCRTKKPARADFSYDCIMTPCRGRSTRERGDMRIDSFGWRPFTDNIEPGCTLETAIGSRGSERGGGGGACIDFPSIVDDVCCTDDLRQGEGERVRGSQSGGSRGGASICGEKMSSLRSVLVHSSSFIYCGCHYVRDVCTSLRVVVERIA